MKTIHPFISTLFATIITGYAAAQSLGYPVVLPYAGLTACSALQNDPLSFTANQAALAAVKQAGLAVYGERRFLLAATSFYTLAAAIPVKLGQFGLQLNYAGFKNFNESKIGLAYAKKLGTAIDAGIQFDYYSNRIPGYSNVSCINAQLGLILHFTEKLHGGFHVNNPGGSKPTKNAALIDNKEKPATTYKMSLGYDASTNFFVSSEIIKEEDKPVNVVAGIQYHFDRQFFVRAGIATESSSVFCGTGLSWNNLRVDIAGSYHPQLGFSPAILLVTSFGKAKE